jgi:formamidopyrimidine-DNA glycosylase
MPELPEVETIARGVNARVSGDRIVEAWFGSHREPFKTPAALQALGLEGRTIVAVHRTGKHIVCELARVVQGAAVRDAGSAHPTPDAQIPDAQWIVHLGMTGRLLVTTPEGPLAPHTHARLLLGSGREIRFVDPRRFGRLEFRELRALPESSGAASKDALGAGFRGAGEEPLTIGAEAFAALFRGRKLAIKAALLNQTLLTGVGNIYADESLFRAGIRPRRRAGRLTRAELERLRAALKLVLEHAIKLGGSSVSDYVDADGVRGFFQLEHCVYLRTGQPCRVCRTPIRRILVGGRGTHYCPQCQH